MTMHAPTEAAATCVRGCCTADSEDPVVCQRACDSDTEQSADLVPLPPLLRLALDGAESEVEEGGSHGLCRQPSRKYRRIDRQPLPQATLSPELQAALDAHQARYLPQGQTIESFARACIATEGLEDNFYIYDLAVVERLYAAWCKAMPRVHPCYAVKCNPDPAMLRVLAALSAGFDCASDAEIAAVLAAGAGPDRIIYAHPCKPPSHIRRAAAQGVSLTTFDTECELQKMARLHPGCALLLRIRADDPSARCQLGNKYGAEPADAPRLLAAARELGLAVCGVSFHVGSGAKNPLAFRDALEAARRVFDLGTAAGFDMRVLDIGGGFCGGELGSVPAAVNEALDRLFPEDGKLRVIAEPGRYFAEAAATYFCCVNGWREREAVGAAPPFFDYYISDGLYGSMNCLIYDHADLQPRPLRTPLLPPVAEEGLAYPTTLFGPTCDGLDTVCRGVLLPRLRAGDFVVFPKFGAYTVAGAVNFNGFDVAGAQRFYVYSGTALPSDA